MADETKTKVKIDLDTVDFIRDALKAEDSIKRIGQSDNLKGLVEGLISTGKVLGIVGAAAFAVKTAFDLALDAENIKSVNAQFDILSDNLGIVGGKFKSELEAASKGLIDDTNLLKLANEAMVELGGSAARLPELMGVAHKASIIFGRDFEETIKAIDLAIATGNQRMLKRMGIVIDSDKATRDWAAAHHVAVGALSESEKRQAMLNAVIEYGNTRMKTADPEIRAVTIAWTQFKVAIKDIGEILTLSFDKIAGPSIAKLVTSLKDLAERTKVQALSWFGNEAEKSSANIHKLEFKLKDLNSELSQLENKKGFDLIGSMFPSVRENTITKLKDQISELRKEIEAAKAESVGGEEPLKRTGAAKESDEDKRKRLMSETKFNQDIAALQKEALKMSEDNATSEAQVFENVILRKMELRDEAAIKMRQIDADDLLNDEQKAIVKLQIEENLQRNLEAIESDANQRIDAQRVEALDRWVKASSSANEAVARSFQAGAAKARITLDDFGATGRRVYDSFQKNATNSLMALGEGTKSAGEAAKGFIFGMLGDEAEARGKLILASSIWPPNPAGLAAGAGLMVLAGWLRSQGKGGGAGGGGGGAEAASAGAAGETTAATRTEERPQLEEAQKKKMVTLEIHGNYFDTDSTRRQILEMIRQETDATDFKYVQIGQT